MRPVVQSLIPINLPPHHTTLLCYLVAFSDGTLTDALRLIGADITVNKRVKKKLVLVLSSWKEQYASEPSMSLVAGLYKQCRVAEKHEKHLYDMVGLDHAAEKKIVEKEERKKARAAEKEAAKERARREEEERRRNKNKPKRVPFNFERVSGNIAFSISSSASLLVEDEGLGGTWRR